MITMTATQNFMKKSHSEKSKIMECRLSIWKNVYGYYDFILDLQQGYQTSW